MTANASIQSNLDALLFSLVGPLRASRIVNVVVVPPALVRAPSGQIARTEIAFALYLLLFEDLLSRAPSAELYVQGVVRSGQKLFLDHGALRTVAAPCGELPQGYLAFARILEPLGYRVVETYPLDRLAMTGRAYCHIDHPEIIPQFFVSELHPENFSHRFQAAVQTVLSSSKDPLSAEALALLGQLGEKGTLPFDVALRLLPELASAFDRHHGLTTWEDYSTLLEESAEMAWIATEGNAFNHATDRVEDVQALSSREKALGRSMKDRVEVSASGRVLQTACRATEVERVFVDAKGNLVMRKVPGSFFEFITRKHKEDGSLDLSFDTSNAQAIFKMTSATT